MSAISASTRRMRPRLSRYVQFTDLWRAVDVRSAWGGRSAFASNESRHGGADFAQLLIGATKRISRALPAVQPRQDRHACRANGRENPAEQADDQREGDTLCSELRGQLEAEHDLRKTGPERCGAQPVKGQKRRRSSENAADRCEDQ